MDTQNIGIVILAAGASSRLGQPKQLLPYQGKTLLQHTLQVAIASAPTVIVVLGAHAPDVEKKIEEYPIQIVINKNWQEGIASSIRYGIKWLMDTMPQAEAALLMLCDQPFVTSQLLNDLIAARKHTGKTIVASAYNNTLGVPALFQKNIFPELLRLKGDVGAKMIIQQHVEDTHAMPFAKGEVDIDTPADYTSLRNTPTLLP